MRLLLNIIWVVFGGFFIWLEYMLGGLLLCCTIIGIPFGLQCFKLAWLGLLPFGKDVYDDPEALSGGTLGFLMNVIWLLVGGLGIFLTHIGLVLAYGITIIGIPFAIQHLKLSLLALTPFGKGIR